MKVGKQVQSLIKSDDKKTVQESTFERLGLSAEISNCYPYELSGGMARRVLIATAMVSNADLVIADEPTPGLDEDLRQDIISAIQSLATKNDKGLMFITHDINAALQIADNIAVVNSGKTLEIAPKSAFSGSGENLQHPYTKALWKSLPENWSVVNGQLKHRKKVNL